MKIDKIASVADIVLGAWLLLSVVVWRHSPHQLATTVAVGALSVVLGTLAYRGHVWARWIVGALAVWLFVSVWVTDTRSVATVVNQLTVASLLFGFSVLPTGRGRAIGDSPLRPSAD
jgi:uncharacterized membrane protein YoaT (DUF817 family)